MVIVVELGTGALKVAVVVEQLEPPQKLLRTPAHECDEMGGTQKPVPVNQPDYLTVALRQLDWENSGGAFEAGKAGRFHPPTISERKEAKKPSGLALRSNFLRFRYRLSEYLGEVDLHGGGNA